MITETKINTTTRIGEILTNLNTVDECGSASKVIDFYEKKFPQEVGFIKECRDFLCDKTFELYLKKYK